ncbi:MAG: RluA family pseudouridine synthase [Oscillospiraceae bacterium]|nr:RluA family pseudouridine synthase [Oscillospiraceae bacterium]
MLLEHIAEYDAPLRVYLRREFCLSSTLVKRLKFSQAFFVNGLPARTNFAVKAGDVLRVVLEEESPAYPAENGDLDILYEDEALIALDKPAGVLVHPSRARNTGTLANFLAGYYGKTGEHCAVHPISRLDRDTFGVVLFAKNSHVHARMHEQLRCGGIEKIYHALVFGAPKETVGLIDAPIARLSETSLLRCIRADGKPAKSAYRVLAKDAHSAILRLQPLTGRTHQLRLHCAHIGCPILGDPQYASAQSQAYSEAQGIFGQQLCAHSLRFTHPLRGEEITLFSRLKICSNSCILDETGV